MSLRKPHPLLAASLVAAVVCCLALPAARGVVEARAHGAQGGTLIVDYLDDFSSLDTGKCYDG